MRSEAPLSVAPKSHRLPCVYVHPGMAKTCPFCRKHVYSQSPPLFSQLSPRNQKAKTEGAKIGQKAKKMVQPLWNNTAWQFLRRLNMEVPYDPRVLLGVYPRDSTHMFPGIPVHPSSMSHHSSKEKRPQMGTGVGKQEVVCSHNGTLFSCKKEGSPDVVQHG